MPNLPNTVAIGYTKGMITWLVGENSFEVREALDSIVAQFDGPPERIDGTGLTLAQLPDLLMGVSLFSMERLVIITELSQNSTLWEKLPEWLPRVSDSIHLVLVDAKPDKRRTSYKALKEASTVHEFLPWTDRDVDKATRWVSERAKSQHIQLDGRIAKLLVDRVGLDQWQLSYALDKLALLDTVTAEQVLDIIPENPTDSVFQLFETALDGDAHKVASKLKTLLLHEDPYAMFALVSSQVMSLAAIAAASPGDAPAKDFGMHPFVVTKLGRYVKRLGRSGVATIVHDCAQTDADLKRSKAAPELLLEKFLLHVAVIAA